MYLPSSWLLCTHTRCTRGAPPEIKTTDFDDRIDVLPVSDPNIFSMSQRIALAQTELQLVQSNPERYTEMNRVCIKLIVKCMKH